MSATPPSDGPPGGPEADLEEVLHLHKAPPCQDVARRRCGHTNDLGPWEELEAHLVRLAVGVGLDPDSFRERHESLLELGV